MFITANEWSSWGGSELLWTQAAEKCARAGMDVHVSVPNLGKPIKELGSLRSAGCRILQRRTPSLFRRFAQKVFPLPEYTLTHVRDVGKGAGLIVVSQGTNREGLPWMEAARASGHRYAIIAHSAAQFHWPDDDIAERLAASYERADRAYFVSQAVLDLSRQQFGTPLLNAKVIRNPFNVPYDASLTWPEHLGEKLLLACVARLEVGVKGQDLLLDVLALPQWREREVCVSLVGDGINERVLRRRVEQLGLTSVAFMGYQNDIEDIWRNHHALVLPSRQEGMPLALVEAMLCGRPGIVTDVGGNRELVRDGVNGFLAKAPTLALLDEAMNRAWASRDHLKRTGETAATDVRKWVNKEPAEEFMRELQTLFH